ncbi:hypothetical protein K2173_025551 [Erythroxylum novogranatense]|uniref:Histone-lysine N-methyltransferase SUVR3 n=1 Tax=Erythroxylum novogranatense TaxID=1862640 RepID=A0AAV8T8M4_9ROSI|nr:hypothetical protein K2173_025551 [Erythroxylum novogranatense]
MKGQVKKKSETTQLHPLIECAELILPWLNPQELSNISLTCKALSLVTNSITRHRSLDAARSLEDFPLPFGNSLFGHPPYAYFLYTPSQVLPFVFHSSRQPWGSPSLPCCGGPKTCSPVPCGCGCDGCGEEWAQGLPGMGLEIVSECGPCCGCGLECGNRLTQRGISAKLKIVRDSRKGWCLFADQLIHRGQFICEYAGELLTTKEARRRQQIYDELASGGCASSASALLVVREHLPSGKVCLRINIDATKIGNAARFINHSCDGGNLFTVLVRNSGAILPRVCFFASKDIKEGEELTFSYGETRVSSKCLPCFCGSSCCFGTLPSENT